MFSAMEPLNLVLLAVAAIVVWRMWSVLGTRTGFEKPPIVLSPAPEKAKPAPTDVEPSVVQPAPEDSQPVWQGHAEEGSDLAKGLTAIAARNAGFTVPSFLGGASAAYEMVLEAFATGNKQALKPLLSKELYDSFVSAIDARKTNGHTMTFQFVGVKSAKIIDAQLLGNKAEVEVAFVAEMISATQDKASVVIEGDATAIRTVADTWTFERDVTTRDPNWKLVSTQDHV